MTTAIDIRNQISKLQEKLSKLENENSFTSPIVELPKSIENAIAWSCIVKGHDIYVAGEGFDIFYTLVDDYNFVKVCLVIK